ncbi:thioredoxin fold domain-containing protein [Tardiphaga sp. 37S4]|jgi:thioredoxin-related protein|uniref:thioredoxin fold domain-containing protein n=1 Tax=Tardiphaga sp. 37S4 TaxID=1404741 RepID=UPI001E5F0411|nr:thioredoxin fold domain-containing protein [Tardiphaga sp. 37S4]UFS77296.1 thioredoxin fold domain-containing protein [Tardiphaga sp. 37S4]
MTWKLPLKTSLIATLLVMTAALSPRIADASELLMFERDGCVWCARWNREIAPVYDKTDEAKLLPLRRIDMDRDKSPGVALASPVRFTPTFLIVDNGREIGRITGYMNDESFWSLLGKYAARLSNSQPNANRS